MPGLTPQQLICFAFVPLSQPETRSAYIKNELPTRVIGHDIIGLPVCKWAVHDGEEKLLGISAFAEEPSQCGALITSSSLMMGVITARGCADM